MRLASLFESREFRGRISVSHASLEYAIESETRKKKNRRRDRVKKITRVSWKREEPRDLINIMKIDVQNRIFQRKIALIRVQR